jgi:hypothetical protein
MIERDFRVTSWRDSLSGERIKPSRRMCPARPKSSRAALAALPGPIFGLVGCRAVLTVLMLVVATQATQAANPAPDDGDAAAVTDRSAEKTVKFARDILPILSDKCFICHGPDSGDHGALRLDSHEAAMEDRGGYRVIDPAAPEQSVILQRIFSDDDPMPPADAEKHLSESEKNLLRNWVLEGGEYQQHWAFVPPTKALVDGQPAERDQVIDHFVESRLQQAGFELAPSADRHILARRAALVLTGLPPEPDQLARFLEDQTAGAYDRYLDELFASVRYGEHQSRYWLDAVRYGDTHGLHLDNRRGIYPYRDWVVRAMNQNLPLDQFITWQLAGDLLPDPTLEQLTATGFVRMNPSTGEGGAIAEEFQAKNNFDRTETLGTVLLGMSLVCARCHTHKYDPIPHREYYALMAFFNSTAEPALDGNSYTYGDTASVPSDQAGWEAWEQMRQTRSHLLTEAATWFDDPENFTAWKERQINKRSTATAWQLRTLDQGDQGLTPEEVLAGDGWQMAEVEGDNLAMGSPAADQTLWLQRKIEAEADLTLWCTLEGVNQAEAWIDGAPLAIDLDSGRQSIPHEFPLVLHQGQHQLVIKITGGGTGGKFNVSFDEFAKRLASVQQWSDLSEADRLRILSDPAGPLATGSITIPKAERAGRTVQAGEAGTFTAAEVSQLRRDQMRLERTFTTTLVARDLSTPRVTHVLRRGEYDLPIGDPVEPDVPAVLGSLPEGAPRNRLGLARWLTSPEHPLVSRVIVNRIWQRTFGFGLVRTPEDFGLQGQQPTHPELLDWLAVDLVESGWDMKRLLRLMVTSRTFQQSSRRRPEVDDPDNRLLARGPSFRLDAEVIRDLGLWAANLLNPHAGGEGVKPYQPTGMWEALAHPASNTKAYEPDDAPLIYRRSLYVYWKRTSPHPMMTLFDAPDRESSCVRRSRTNTSLQSLGLFNESQRIEMGRGLAERLIRHSNNPSDRLELMYRLVASRDPDDAEANACATLVQTMQDRYRAAPDDALALLAVGQTPRDPDLDATEVAAWTQLCVTVLASDSAILLY